MASNGRERVLVVLSLSGGNDFLNTLIPYTDPIYMDYRRSLAIPGDQVLPLNDELGYHPSMTEMKEIYDVSTYGFRSAGFQWFQSASVIMPESLQ